MSRPLATLVFAFLMACASLTGVHARELANPDKTQIDLLYRYLASDPPDFQRIAREHYDVRTANEFERSAVARRIEDNLREDYQRMADVDTLRLRIRAKLSEYDSGNGGFYLSSFAPGSFFRYGAIGLGFENADRFHLWPVPVSNARQIVEQIGYSREVILDLTVRPFGIDGARNKRLRSQITGFDVYSRQNNTQFDSVRLPQSEYRDIMIAGLEETGQLDPAKRDVVGFTAGMTITDALNHAASSGYWMLSLVEDNATARQGQDAINALTAIYEDYRKSPPLYIGSDERSFELAAPSSLGNPFAGPTFKGDGIASIFGDNLDCNVPDNLGVKCAIIRFERADDPQHLATPIKSVALLQSASGISRSQVMALLTEKYGPPSDTITTPIFKRYQSRLMIWGRNQQQDKDKLFFTDMTRSQNWEMEAYIFEPDGQRVVVITHMTVLPDQPAVASGNKGGIRF